MEECEERAGASCHSAGLRAKLEMVWQVQFPPRDPHLEICSWTWAGSPREPVSSCECYPPEAVQTLCCL